MLVTTKKILTSYHIKNTTRIIWLKLRSWNADGAKKCPRRAKVARKSVSLTIGFDSIKDGWFDIERTTDRSPSWRARRWNAPLATSKATLTLCRAVRSAPFCEPMLLDWFKKHIYEKDACPALEATIIPWIHPISNTNSSICNLEKRLLVQLRVIRSGRWMDPFFLVTIRPMYDRQFSIVSHFQWKPSWIYLCWTLKEL